MGQEMGQEEAWGTRTRAGLTVREGTLGCGGAEFAGVGIGDRCGRELAHSGLERISGQRQHAGTALGAVP
jgi:hypothetical protein